MCNKVIIMCEILPLSSAGVILSNLQEVSLKSTRNLAILGLSLLVGIMVPYFIEAHPEIIETGKKLLPCSDADIGIYQLGNSGHYGPITFVVGT